MLHICESAQDVHILHARKMCLRTCAQASLSLRPLRLCATARVLRAVSDEDVTAAIASAPKPPPSCMPESHRPVSTWPEALGAGGDDQRPSEARARVSPLLRRMQRALSTLPRMDGDRLGLGGFLCGYCRPMMACLVAHRLLTSRFATKANSLDDDSYVARPGQLRKCIASA